MFGCIELQTGYDKAQKDLIAAEERETSFLDHIKTLQTTEEETNKDLDAANEQVSRLNGSLHSCLEKVENCSKHTSSQRIALQQCEQEAVQLKLQIKHSQK